MSIKASKELLNLSLKMHCEYMAKAWGRGTPRMCGLKGLSEEAVWPSCLSSELQKSLLVFFLKLGRSFCATSKFERALRRKPSVTSRTAPLLPSQQTFLTKVSNRSLSWERPQDPLCPVTSETLGDVALLWAWVRCHGVAPELCPWLCLVPFAVSPCLRDGEWNIPRELFGIVGASAPPHTHPEGPCLPNTAAGPLRKYRISRKGGRRTGRATPSPSCV